MAEEWKLFLDSAELFDPLFNEDKNNKKRQNEIYIEFYFHLDQT